MTNDINSNFLKLNKGKLYNLKFHKKEFNLYFITKIFEISEIC